MATASRMKKVGDYEIDLDPKETLGRTPKCTVHPGRYALGGTDVAAQLYVWDKDFPSDVIDNEVSLVRNISEHINVLKIIDYIKTQEGNFMELWIILELCTLGNLAKYAEKKSLSIIQKVDLILQGSRRVQHLHSQKPSIIHRNISMENLLVTGDEDDPVVKVGGFSEVEVFAPDPGKSVMKAYPRGIPNYRAPEMYRVDGNHSVEYNQSVDVFGMGISALTLVEEQHGKPIRTYTVEVGGCKKALGRHIHEEKITDVAEIIRKPGDSEDVKRFKTIIASMLAPDAQTRLTIHGVVDRLTQLRSELGVQKRTLHVK